jgi:hypothetical protein
MPARAHLLAALLVTCAACAPLGHLETIDARLEKIDAKLDAVQTDVKPLGRIDASLLAANQHLVSIGTKVDTLAAIDSGIGRLQKLVPGIERVEKALESVARDAALAETNKRLGEQLALLGEMNTKLGALASLTELTTLKTVATRLESADDKLKTLATVDQHLDGVNERLGKLEPLGKTAEDVGLARFAVVLALGLLAVQVAMLGRLHAAVKRGGPDTPRSM